MALSATEAVNRQVAQTLSITAAAVALNTYAASDGTPAAVAATGSASSNTVELVRDVTGAIFGIRGNAGAVISKIHLRSPESVFRFLFEGSGAAGTKVGG